ncbi:ubiquitin-conjugating enzyme E2 Z-like [Dermacentor silvarum]|uniref:ubiquitin-conjugating enzyme E2 Z-like n=1 Tax=Dermacentor silvarum TaxID=543639 RepID=UPI001898A57C|nr:ubiquitin-conjugating enzyme E2 Z-like [Dermacentor silvarum]
MALRPRRRRMQSRRPPGTPYDGGVFRFLLKCPTDFPAEPPRVRLMTTDAGRVWFGPNPNVDGMVCLSLLGTWGPVSKSSVHIIWTVLRAIESLMTARRFHKTALVRGRA